MISIRPTTIPKRYDNFEVDRTVLPALPVLSVLPVLPVLPVMPVLPVLPLLPVLPVPPVLPVLAVLRILCCRYWQYCLLRLALCTAFRTSFEPTKQLPVPTKLHLNFQNSYPVSTLHLCLCTPVSMYIDRSTLVYIYIYIYIHTYIHTYI